MFSARGMLLASKSASKRLSFGIAGVSCVPDTPKLKRGGEDAFFISLDRRGLGVADGVGGWASEGVNPAIYARDLMKSTNQVLDLEKAQGKQSSSARDVLEAGFLLTQMHRIVGSCTAVAAVIKDDTTLSLCHIGDSGALVLAPPKDDCIDVVHRTVEQQYRFNFPHQLGTGSDSSPKSSGGAYELENVAPGSVVVLYTDGVSDNVPMEDIVEIVKGVFAETSKSIGHRNVLPETSCPQLNCVDTAKKIARAAFRNAHDKRYNSPFAQGAAAAGMHYRGGKPDDITVVVGQVFPSDFLVDEPHFDTTDRFVDTLDFDDQYESASKV